MYARRVTVEIFHSDAPLKAVWIVPDREGKSLFFRDLPSQIWHDKRFFTLYLSGDDFRDTKR